MTDLKISQLPLKSPLTGAEEVAINDAGSSKRATVTSVRPQQTYLGYNTIGGTTDVMGAGAYKQVFQQIVTTQTYLFLSIDAYVKGNASNVTHQACAIWDDVAGAPSKVIALGAGPGETTTSVLGVQLLMGTTARWISEPICAWLPAGTYWLNVQGGNTGFTLHYDAVGNDRTATTSQTWINEGVTGAGSGRTYSVRASVLAF